ncbi:hypothetical protein D2T29_08525 [Sinirhodobacter populi]|uniref:Sulfate transporter family protein n=2 Tax=Paenirhodobacter populi TaxID=2306993 RepID=A0A443KHJ7_9RHOB|nr:hypothetical protein D2T29_08525 [Sinirhodobacter populi]
MMFPAILRGWQDLIRPEALKILLLGIALALGLLIALGVATIWLLGLLLPDTVNLPFWGPVTWVDAAAGWVAVAVFLFASIFLMAPVASIFTGFFLDDVAGMVEREHYPDLPPVKPLGLLETLGDTLKFFGVVIAANLVALMIYPFVIPFAPFLFLALNGYLLGREYFQMAAIRRMSRAEARALYERNKLTVWITGAIMAVPLSVPVLNLVVPVVGAAAFTHLFHDLARRQLVA